MNWFIMKFQVLVVLLLFCSSLVVEADTDDEKIPNEQKLDSSDADIKDKVRSFAPPNIVDQIFSQRALRPSLAYHPGQSINYNLGYNLGRTIGKSMDPFYNSFPALANFISYWFSQAPFLGVPLDRHPDSSKVVLVLANDTPETSALPHADPETLKRLVRTPDFWDQFASHMAAFREQMSQQVPAMSRTFGEGLNEFMSKTPILSDAHQTGAIDFANLGQTFGEKFLAPNLFSGIGDNKSTDDSSSSDGSSTPSPTERAENELSSIRANPLLPNPLFRSLQSFVPQGFPTPPPFGNMFKTVPTWPWMNQNQEGASSNINEVRIRPGSETPYRISPKEAVSQKMAEMKLRAAMKDALEKKTIPILWFSMPANNGKLTTSDSEKWLQTSSTPMSEEDMMMRSKLMAFEKQLITELKQLQEVVKLANAMKKAQLESTGKKFEVTDTISPLALNNTPIYKITLADIEKTLKDEYVRKLLQLIYNSQHKDMQMHPARSPGAGAKYSPDVVGNPNKRQTSSVSDAMANLNKEDMMRMMAYAYRMAAANGVEVPWQMNDKSTEQSPQKQLFDAQSNMQNEQQRMSNNQHQMSMRIGGNAEMMSQHGQNNGGHINSQWQEPKRQMERTETANPMDALKQQQWFDSNMQTNQQAFQPAQSPEQRQSFESNTQMNQQRMQQLLMEQANQRQWSEFNAQMNQQNFQNAMMELAKQRQWQEANGQMNPQQMPRQPMDMMNMQQGKPLDSDSRSSQQPTIPQQAEQRQWLDNNGRPSPIPSQMRQTMPISTNTNAEMPRQQWFDDKTENRMQQQTPMNPNANEQLTPNMNSRQMNERQMPQANDAQQQWQMTNNGNQPNTQMFNGQSQNRNQENFMQSNTADKIADSIQNDQKATDQLAKGDERQMMANHDTGMPANSNEATPQMPENAGKERHKGLEDFFSDLDMFGHHGKKGKQKEQSKGTTINYYYNAGGSRYPPIYGSPGGYAHPAPPSYGGYGGGHAYPSHGGYSKQPQHSGYYGGGGYGSNAYGSHGGYRTAVGDEEIEQMLRQHQTLPKMMLLLPPPHDDNTKSTVDNPLTGTRTSSFLGLTQSNAAPQSHSSFSSSSASTEDGKAAIKSLVKSTPSIPASEPSLEAPAPLTDNLFTAPTTVTPIAVREFTSSSQPLSSSSSFAEDIQSSDSKESRSMFSFDPKILQPFMGLQEVDRKDDPWHHKAYDLYQPIFTGGGTFESLLNRYRRQASNDQTNISQPRNVLTPGMLDRLLRIKVDFEKNYPFLYKTMMGHLMGDKHTTLSITPPEIPKQVSYPNVELAAAELHQLEMLVEQLKKENRHYSPNHQEFDPSTLHPHLLESLQNSYNSEKNYWNKVKQSQSTAKSFWQQLEDSEEEMSPIRKTESFWSQLDEAEEREKRHKSNFKSPDYLDRLFKNDDDFD